MLQQVYFNNYKREAVQWCVVVSEFTHNQGNHHCNHQITIVIHHWTNHHCNHFCTLSDPGPVLILILSLYLTYLKRLL